MHQNQVLTWRLTFLRVTMTQSSTPPYHALVNKLVVDSSCALRILFPAKLLLKCIFLRLLVFLHLHNLSVFTCPSIAGENGEMQGGFVPFCCSLIHYFLICKWTTGMLCYSAHQAAFNKKNKTNRKQKKCRAAVLLNKKKVCKASC